jgi:hypothetical protein
MPDEPQQWFAVPLRGEVPIAFLPVRIETRFGNATDGSAQLLVRVFPDDVHGDRGFGTGQVFGRSNR